MATATITSAAPTSTSTSAPDIPSKHPLSSSSILPSPSLDAFIMSSPRNISSNTSALTRSPSASELSSGSPDSPGELDPRILEALRGKDRLFVLKLGEQMESLIQDRRARMDLTPATSYQRLLVHRCSAYYNLFPEPDNATKSIAVHWRPESKIPAQRMIELVPVEHPTQPAFRIMQRGTQDGTKSRQNSQAGSIAGEEADLSDVEPSEAGSIGGRSNITGGSTKKHRTLEEREAAYNEARNRIFMKFEEKEKEKDASANSSTLSLFSGTGSTGGGRSNSIGDLDDSASSLATESEWSGPATRDKRDSRIGGSGGSSTQSLRSSNTSYNNGSGSSRDSRTTSPSFTYASLYEPPAVGEYGNHPPPAGYFTPYYYPPYAGQPSGSSYGYPYYLPYGGYSGPHMPDASSHMPTESMYSLPQQTTPPQLPYMSYMWPHPPANQSVPQPPVQPQSPLNTGLNLPHTSHPSSPPPPQNVIQPAYPPYMPHPQYNPYTMQGYPPHPHPPPPPPFPPNNQYGLPSGPPSDQSLYMPDTITNNGFIHGGGSGTGSNNHSRASSRSSNSHHGGNKRGAPRARGSWSYGPGTANNGFTFNTSGIGGSIGPGDTVGPRLSSNFRRISGASSTSGSAGTRTPGDEASSTASSSTSSSSRQTYTSASSKHPLPPRPDWAVGLKAQPGLHPPRNHDHNNAHSRNMSPARIGGQLHLAQAYQSQPELQSNDFPPLSSGPERRPPVGGAWTNASSMRSIMTPGSQSSSTQHGSALVHYPNSNQTSQNSIPRTDDQESGFERPPPKSNAELFNPKASSRTGVSNGAGDRGVKTGSVETQDEHGQDGADASLVKLVGSMTLDSPMDFDRSTLCMRRPPSAVPSPPDDLNGEANGTSNH
ncbi:uncharacterized protein FIBRA_00602 [Fibroporia radiculosa]|uniref:SUZ domain-containing protein n=1 Tax=Fibroporia radiculosa TaxID=599839 RepID=J4GI55_9APHY|nr:uncharacterized protein FIBRA_00602 [Fibroporia radiculosa]CCL98600.1 predicted protein [Fibroporia radiculosa]